MEEADNNFTVTTYDSVAQTISGTFRVTMAVAEAFRIDEVDFPDTLKITDGKFSFPILPNE